MSEQTEGYQNIGRQYKISMEAHMVSGAIPPTEKARGLERLNADRWTIMSHDILHNLGKLPGFGFAGARAREQSLAIWQNIDKTAEGILGRKSGGQAVSKEEDQFVVNVVNARDPIVRVPNKSQGPDAGRKRKLEVVGVRQSMGLGEDGAFFHSVSEGMAIKFDPDKETLGIAGVHARASTIAKTLQGRMNYKPDFRADGSVLVPLVDSERGTGVHVLQMDAKSFAAYEKQAYEIYGKTKLFAKDAADNLLGKVIENRKRQNAAPGLVKEAEDLAEALRKEDDMQAIRENPKYLIYAKNGLALAQGELQGFQAGLQTPEMQDAQRRWNKIYAIDDGVNANAMMENIRERLDQNKKVSNSEKCSGRVHRLHS